MEHRLSPDGQEEKIQKFVTKFGIIMFAIYTIVYFAFIIIAVTNPQFMGKDVGNLNVAITYGFGIIILAIIQALIYSYICGKRENAERSGKGKSK